MGFTAFSDLPPVEGLLNPDEDRNHYGELETAFKNIATDPNGHFVTEHDITLPDEEDLLPRMEEMADIPVLDFSPLMSGYWLSTQLISLYIFYFAIRWITS